MHVSAFALSQLAIKLIHKTNSRLHECRHDAADHSVDKQIEKHRGIDVPLLEPCLDLKPCVCLLMVLPQCTISILVKVTQQAQKP